MLSFFKNEVDDTKKYFLCAFPYQLSMKEGLLDPEAVADEMSEEGFNEIKWSINISVLLKPIEPVCLRGVLLAG